MKNNSLIIFNVVLFILVIISLILSIISIFTKKSSSPEKYIHEKPKKNICDRKNKNTNKNFFVQMKLNNGKNIYDKTYQLFSICGNFSKGLETCSPDVPLCQTTKVENKNCCKNPSEIIMHIGDNYQHRIATSVDGKDTNWAFVDMFNKSLSWTVNFGNSVTTGIGCNRIATFYACTLPYGHEYVDAQVGYPEFDFMEANLYGWHTTAHQHWDKEGLKLGYGGDCPKKNYFKDESGSIKNTYGPGPNFKINTLKEFRAFLTQKFDKNLNLEEMTITLKQNQNKISVSSRNKSYMNEFGKEYYGNEFGNNAFFWSLWETDKSWLNTPPCPDGKIDSGTGPYVFKDLSILSNDL